MQMMHIHCLPNDYSMILNTFIDWNRYNNKLLFITRFYNDTMGQRNATNCKMYLYIGIFAVRLYRKTNKFFGILFFHSENRSLRPKAAR